MLMQDGSVTRRGRTAGRDEAVLGREEGREEAHWSGVMLLSFPRPKHFQSSSLPLRSGKRSKLAPAQSIDNT